MQRFAFVAWVLLASVCLGQDAPAPKTESYTWHVFRTSAQGEPESIGSEEVKLVVSEAQHELSSTSKLSLGPQPLELTQRLVVDSKGEFLRYSINSGTHALTCELTDKGVLLRGTVMGGKQERTLVPEEFLICLDNLAWSHFDVVGLHTVKRGKPFAFTALVPQAMLGLPARVTLGEETRVTDGSQSRRARRAKLVAANLVVEFVYDVSSGVAYEIAVPAQRLLARRGDWRLESAPEPVKEVALPQGLRELAITVPTPGYELGLPGRLTLPTAEGPFVTALLLSGSGAHDFDETIGPNKPLRDMAWGLAEQGVASLRVTKRTKHVLDRVTSSNGEEQQTLSKQLAGMGLKEEYLDDSQAALAFLRSRPELRGDALVVVGHSQGALMAPEIASVGSVQAVVLLAGPGRPLDQLLADQIYAGQLRLGKIAEDAAIARDKTLEPLKGLSEVEAPTGRFLGASLAYWKDTFTRDPVALVTALKQPVCVVWGARDVQVTQPDYDALAGALATRANPKDGCFSYPTLNHLFMPCDEGATGAEYMLPARVASKVVVDVAAWIRAATGGE